MAGLIGYELEKAVKKAGEGVKIVFVEVCSSKNKYPCKRVIRQTIAKTQDGETLVLTYAGFPVLNGSNIS